MSVTVRRGVLLPVAVEGQIGVKVRQGGPQQLLWFARRRSHCQLSVVAHAIRPAEVDKTCTSAGKPDKASAEARHSHLCKAGTKLARYALVKRKADIRGRLQGHIGMD